MPPPHGIFTYPGINSAQVSEFSISSTHGVGPANITVHTAPGTTVPQANGTVTITFGTSTVTFPNCRFVRTDFALTEEDYTEVITLQDRRWKWEFGTISGRYNQRIGENIIPLTQRTVPQLMTLCLNAMNELNPDLTQVPNLPIFPEIDWDYVNPAYELDNLCEIVSCRLVLDQIADRVRILPIGTGALLPINNNLLEPVQSYDPPEIPDSFVVASAFALFELDIPLEAVALESDGRVLPLYSSSYVPLSGYFSTWDLIDIINPNVNLTYAEESVFRWYRIKVPFTEPFFGNVINSIDEILPLESEGVQVKTLFDGTQERLPPRVYGIFYSGNDDFSDNTLFIPNPPSLDFNTYLEPEETFQLDKEKGIVKFSDIVCTLGPSFPGANTISMFPATLFLRVAVSYRSTVNFQFQRWEFPLASGSNSGTRPKYEIHEDVKVEHYINDQTGVIVNNLVNAQGHANYHLSLMAQSYQGTAPAQGKYSGLQLIPLDASIHQVDYTLDAEGFVSTTLYRNRENPIFAVPYKEKKIMQSTIKQRAEETLPYQSVLKSQTSPRKK